MSWSAVPLKRVRGGFIGGERKEQPSPQRHLEPHQLNLNETFL